MLLNIYDLYQEMFYATNIFNVNCVHSRYDWHWLNMDFFKMTTGNFAWNRVFSFSQLLCDFWGKHCFSSEIYVFRSDQFSLLVYHCLLPSSVIRDSSAVRRLFVQLAGAVGRQGALHKENSGFTAPTLRRRISTFRGYRILFSIRNPYINRFTNHFSIQSWPSYPQKVVLHSSTARFSHYSFFYNHLSRDFEKTTITAMYHGRWFAYMILPCPKWERENVTHALSEARG